jgi:hypothetical protein
MLLSGVVALPEEMFLECRAIAAAEDAPVWLWRAEPAVAAAGTAANVCAAALMLFFRDVLVDLVVAVDIDQFPFAIGVSQVASVSSRKG